MNYKKFLGAASAALMIVIVITLALAPDAWAASKYKVLYRFNESDGYEPEAGLIFDAAGNLYGTTAKGGQLSLCGGSGCGVVFKLAPNQDGSWTESVLHSFNGSDGEVPVAGLILDAAGNLYGTTGFGGQLNLCEGNGCGVVFKLAPNQDGSWTESVLHSFNGSDGYEPEAGLIFDVAGNLYGTTAKGGQLSLCGDAGGYGCGVVFKLAPNQDGSWTESVLHTFNESDGAWPAAPLIFDAAGNLYGTTDFGGQVSLCGSPACGVVFKLAPNQDGSWTESVLHSFIISDGANPLAGLIFDAAGNLYGTTVGGGQLSLCAGFGCGVVFKLAPNQDGSWTESVLHSFNVSHGAQPFAGLIFDAAGNLYGTAWSGGSANDGAAFKLSSNLDGSWAYSLIHVFKGKPAEAPQGGLVLGSAGTLYGTTRACAGCAGVVYQITP